MFNPLTKKIITKNVLLRNKKRNKRFQQKKSIRINKLYNLFKFVKLHSLIAKKIFTWFNHDKI